MQCKGCKESYKTENRLPRVLQCGHTLCSSCLEREEKESRCCIDCLECCKKDFRTCGEVPINHALAAAVELLEQLQTAEVSRFCFVPAWAYTLRTRNTVHVACPCARRVSCSLQIVQSAAADLVPRQYPATVAASFRDSADS